MTASEKILWGASPTKQKWIQQKELQELMWRGKRLRPEDDNNNKNK